MTARRTGVQRFVVVDDGVLAEREARTGGTGIVWGDEPDALPAAGLAEWRRLARVFERYPLRFREGDRQALATYCRLVARLEQVDAAIDAEGIVVLGRGHGDEERMVKNPLLSTYNQLQQAVRLWVRELGLSPDSRGRASLDEQGEKEDRNDGNPFG